MDFPNFKEIVVEQNTSSDCRGVLAKINNCERPYYIDLSTWPEREIINFATSLSKCLLEAGIDARFPYPIYLVIGKTKLPLELRFLTCEEEKCLPNYFKKEIYANNSREIRKINRLKVYQQALMFLDLNKKLEMVEGWKEKDQEIYTLSQENKILNKILLGMNKASKD